MGALCCGVVKYVKVAPKGLKNNIYLLSLGEVNLKNELKSKFNANTIILGFSGSIGSGCTYIAKGLSERYEKYKYYSLSDTLRKLAKDNNINEDVESLQNYGNELRRKHDSSYLIKKTIEHITDEPIGIIIDSIRNDGEVKTLRQFPYFYLFSTYAERDMRCDRALKIKKFKNKEAFYKADQRDEAENIPHGQQVKKCNDLADIIITNNRNYLSTAPLTKKQFIDDIYNKYVDLIEKKKGGEVLPEHLPTSDEALMTMAYAESQKSSCLKRKVGAIIALIEEIKVNGYVSSHMHVLSSGHNDVSLGLYPCVIEPNIQKCYRDYLQEEHAKKISHCPMCGVPIKVKPIKCKCGHKMTEYSKSCPKCLLEIDMKTICSNKKCNKEIFPEFLKAGGKLLDMCRALHAEENALLNLAKARRTDKGLVLYTTTYPCNLCANKIVASGINTVVYNDPYPMEDAKKILQAGNVVVKKFEGIKSSAYFRLYYC